MSLDTFDDDLDLIRPLREPTARIASRDSAEHSSPRGLCLRHVRPTGFDARMSLTMSVSPSEVAARIRAEASAREHLAEARAAELRNKLGDAAALLRAAGADRVWIFGSLATGKTHRGSDVDLAVEGLQRGRYFEVLAELMALFGSPVDLVAMEQAPRSLCDAVRSTGRQL